MAKLKSARAEMQMMSEARDGGMIPGRVGAAGMYQDVVMRDWAGSIGGMGSSESDMIGGCDKQIASMKASVAKQVKARKY